MRSSRFNQEHRNAPEQHTPHPWLVTKVYEPMRQRTIDLVRRSVDALLKDKQRISLATVTTKSKELDTEGNGKGISQSAILDNQEARAYYEQHRTWQGTRNKRARVSAVDRTPQPGALKPDRDESRARQRYGRMSKNVLIERLLMVEQTYAEERARWLSQQDEVLIWRLRAQTAETQLQELKAKSGRRKQ
jgi:hypothetical protein